MYSRDESDTFLGAFLRQSHEDEIALQRKSFHFWSGEFSLWSFYPIPRSYNTVCKGLVPRSLLRAFSVVEEVLDRVVLWTIE